MNCSCCYSLLKKTKDKLRACNESAVMMSHDLRNPIGTIYSCSEMLLSNPSFADMSADLRNWICLIKRNADAALKLINDIPAIVDTQILAIVQESH